MNSQRSGEGVDVFINDTILKNAPRCPHGPTLLFERFIAGKPGGRRYYACSANRDRKACSFFQWEDEKIKEKKQEERLMPLPTQQQLWKRMKAVKKLSSNDRNFCRTCGVLYVGNEAPKHLNHSIVSPVSDQQLQRPSTLLHAIDNSRTNAQYFFSEKSTKFLVDLIHQLGVHHVLCIGTPRLFESLNKTDGKVECLLLDIDHRLGQFIKPDQFCHYNMFNHHFFSQESEIVYTNFLKNSFASAPDGKDFLLVIDPPFGGLIDVLAHTITKISHDFSRSGDDIESSSIVPTLWCFPYFMESKMLDRMKSFSMLDYIVRIRKLKHKIDVLYIVSREVSYENHDSFKHRTNGGSKNGSPVRIFTNLRPATITLPPEEGYRFCKVCQRYVTKDNKHCEKCKDCTTKFGRTYRHCDICARCVKPSWTHCTDCNTCEIPGSHTRLVKSSGCHICGELDHKRKDCPRRTTNDCDESIDRSQQQIGCNKKRKRGTTTGSPNKKKK